MRSKEEAHDYRYFPDPDLLPLLVEDSWVEELEKTIPELPAEKIVRLSGEYGIPRYDAGILSSSRALADFFERSVAVYKGAPKTTANECVQWKDAILAGRLSPETIAHAVEDRENGTISATASKKLMEAVLETGKPFRALRDEKGLTQLSDAADTFQYVAEQSIPQNRTEWTELKEYLSDPQIAFRWFYLEEVTPSISQ